MFASTVGTALDDHNVRRQFRVITGAAGAGQRNRADARNQARRAAMTGAGNMHGRDVTGTAFYEWLLSDHPDARAERDWRRAATYRPRRTGRRLSAPGPARSTPTRTPPQTLRDLATMSATVRDLHVGGECCTCRPPLNACE